MRSRPPARPAPQRGCPEAGRGRRASPRPTPTGARPGSYRSQALADRLGLSDLWIAFNGWWPERGATVPTGTFKDLEAFAVLGRFPSHERRPLVVASAGNTAAAFADACTANDL